MAALLFMVMFLQCLNTSLITVPLPDISDDLGISLSDSSWLLLAYSLGTCALLLQFSIYSRNNRTRKFFLYGVGIFTFASFDCYFAQDFLTLVALRFAQGVAISLTAATGPIIVVQKIPAEHKGYAMGLMGAGRGIAMVLGPSLGGIMTQFISWHALFLINIPLGLIVLFGGLLVLPEDKVPVEGNDPDPLGNIGLFVAIAFGLTFLENITEWRGDILFFCGFAAFLGLVMIAWSVSETRRKAPIISTKLVGTRNFRLIAISAMMGSAITEGALYLLPYFMQISWGMGVVECGLYFCIVSVSTFITAKIVGRYCDDHPSRKPVLASFVCTLGFDIVFILIEPGWALALLVMSACMVGISFAVFETAQYLRAMQNCRPEFREEAATLLIVLTYVGASLGLIAYSLTFNAAIPEAAGLEIDQLSAELMTRGFHASGLLGLVIGIFGLILSYIVKDRKTTV